MTIFKTEASLRPFLDEQKANGKRIGFVPTMGALHNGHLSLVKAAKEISDVVVCSIFVNPTQFNDKEDYKHYPITTEEDIQMLESAACDVLFLPQVADMYPEGEENMQAFSFGYLETILEGAQRPGHFRGVGQVVNRLLDIVQPHKLIMGQKDYQQCAVIRELLQQTGRTDIELIVSPTIREQDGLAMSSRNRRLTDPQRALAGIIYQCLVSIQAKKGQDHFTQGQDQCIDLLKDKGFEPEYVTLATADGLQLLDDYQPDIKMVALIAARLGGVRLIDNMII